MNSVILTNIITQIILCTSFIIIFFFTYTKLESQNTINLQLDFLIDQVIGNSKSLLSTTEINKIVSLLKKTSHNNEDANIKKTNNSIYKSAIEYLIKLVLIGLSIIVILIVLSKNKGSTFFKSFKLSECIIYGLIILVVIGITEYIFLTNFSSKYIVLDVPKIKGELLKKIFYYIYSK
jgi:multisubunit Na+/H+ antiporter MnhB subunit